MTRPSPMLMIVAALATGLTALSAATTPIAAANLEQSRQREGNAEAAITGELRQWHKVTLTLDGPQATETDTDPIRSPITGWT